MKSVDSAVDWFSNLEAAGSSALGELFFEADVVLLHFLVERRAVDVKRGGGLLPVPAILLKSVEDNLPLWSDEC